VIDPNNFIRCLEKNDISFFTGVPDSLLKGFCQAIDKKKNHISSINEGSAVGLGVGYYLAKKKIPLIYLQNSGLGNIVNPILSLANKKVFKIPLFFLIGWRGEKSKNYIKKDEPQHIYQGIVTEKLLKILQIKYRILSKNSNYIKLIKDLKKISLKNQCLVALLVRKNTFKNLSKTKEKNIKKKFLLREKILEIILKKIPDKTNIISTTGFLSRELMIVKKEVKKKINPFYCVGGMGHAISIANGIAAIKRKKKILCLDGDGAALMHLGAMAYSGKNKNLIHILINNGVHDSVGSQKIAGEKLNFAITAEGMGYKNIFVCKNKNEIIKSINSAFKKKDSVFIEIKSQFGHRKNLPRPEDSLINLKKKFINHLKQ